MLALDHAQGRVAFLPFCEITLLAPKPVPYVRQPTTLGEHLKKRRYELKLRQKDIAAELGVNEWTVLCWENDRKAPSIRLWPRIIEFLGLYPFPAHESLGQSLLAVRRSLGLSRRRLALRLSVDEGTLAKWEWGMRSPREDHWQRLVCLLRSIS